MTNSKITLVLIEEGVQNYDGWDIKVDGSFIVLNKEVNPGDYLVHVFPANRIVSIISEVNTNG